VEIFLPTLEAKITSLVVTFRFIVFAIMVIGLIAHMASERAQGVNVLRPLVTAVILVTIIASLDQWYPKLDQGALAVADYINPGYTTSPTATPTRSGSPRRRIHKVSRGRGGNSTSRSTRRSPTRSPMSSSISARF